MKTNVHTVSTHKNETAIQSVSYTHLDVYKRQGKTFVYTPIKGEMTNIILYYLLYFFSIVIIIKKILKNKFIKFFLVTKQRDNAAVQISDVLSIEYKI